MGYSLPAALGVKVADPKRQVAVVCGDGSFQMFMNELATLSALKTDAKIVMLKNNVLGLVNEIQTNSYNGPFGVCLDGSPDFELVAKAYGIGYGFVDSDAGVPAAIDAMLAHDGGYLLVCAVDPNESTKY